MSSNKENIPPTESVTPPSLRNLSLEKEADKNENEATSWEASVARNLMTTPRASSPYLKWTSILEDLELDTDNDIIDITDYSERPANDKRSPWPKLLWHTQWLKETSPHPKTAPHIYPWMQWQQHLPSLTELRSRGSSQTREKYPMDGQHV